MHQLLKSPIFPVRIPSYLSHLNQSFITQKIAELIDVCESEFRKDSDYEAQINELTQKIQILEKENADILN